MLSGAYIMGLMELYVFNFGTLLSLPTKVPTLHSQHFAQEFVNGILPVHDFNKY